MTDLPIRHVEVDGKGAFEIVRDDVRLAELTYSRVDDHRVIADHTGVRDALKGLGVARLLLDALVAWARETGTTVLPLCPYVRAQAEKDPSIRDVVVL